MKKICCILFLMMLQHNLSISQTTPVNRQEFFLNDNLIEVNFTTDIKKIRNDKKVPAYQPATISMKFSDSLTITEQIRVQPRGVYRKQYCDMASLMLNFKNPSSPKLSPLKKLKFVGGCKVGSTYEELLLKEFLVYKIQSFLSPLSFRVRLLNVTYNDSKGKVKPFRQYAFLLEDMEDLTARNNCVEIKPKNFFTEATNREQMTFVNLFQYMIGNTDWSIPNLHNMKLMVSKSDTLARPYAVPYDYDYCGLVNADYAVPAEGLQIENVSQRVYRGFPRGLNELETAIEVFKEKKERILYYVEHFELCTAKCRKTMISYLNEFYETINNKKKVQSLFIANARTE
ncbi:MAG: hypothetical protein ABJA90_09715 [Ginsengibacter sp.]